MWNRESSAQGERTGQPRTSLSAVPDQSIEERRVVAWVGKSVVFKGDLTSSEDMTIDGRVEGTIGLRDHSLTIGPDAHIRADIVARRVTVYGAVAGKITASDTVDLRDTASVEGTITSPRLAMADGAVMRGRVETATRAAAQKEKQKELAPA